LLGVLAIDLTRQVNKAYFTLQEDNTWNQKMRSSNMKRPNAPRRGQSTSRAFTLIELLVLVAIVAFLVAMRLPSLARTKRDTQGVSCMNNTKQLTVAWYMYSDDNNGKLVFNTDGTSTGKVYQDESWVGGWLDFVSGNPDNVNTNYLIRHDLSPPSSYLYCGYLGVYLKSPTVFKCPADKATAMYLGKTQPRVRSISMNNFVGQEGRTWSGQHYPSPTQQGSSKYTLYYKIQQVTSPANLFVVLDEHEGSINDGWFVSDPDTKYQIIDYPASYHGNAAGYSFADGHSEIHRFHDPRTMPVVGPGQLLSLNQNLPGDVDLPWMAQKATGLVQPPY
jgi:prepilin-type processing-associated H-X9-DG protein